MLVQLILKTAAVVLGSQVEEHISYLSYSMPTIPVTSFKLFTNS